MSTPYPPEIGAVLDDLGAGRPVRQHRILTFRAELDYVLAQLAGARTELATVTTERDQLRAGLRAELEVHPHRQHWCTGFGNAWMKPEADERPCQVRARLLAALAGTT